ncbi:MAG: ABC transporter ATP-binding protein [Candidatus Stygibacter australis]|nr:ABC transporter ATP-binding protein [Candidatus Stygibacter australis]
MNSFEEYDYNKQFDVGTFRQIGAYLKPMWKNLLILAVLMMMTAGVDIIYPLFNRYAIDEFIIPGNTGGIGLFLAGFLGIFVLQSFNIYFFIVWAGKIEIGLCYRIRRDGFRKLQDLAFRYFDKTPVGWIMARMTSDTGRLSEIISWGLVDMVWGSMLLVGNIIAMLLLNWRLALLSLTIVPVMGVVTFYFHKIILRSYRDVRKTNSRITGAVSEGISGAITTKTLVLEDKNLNDFQKLTRKMFMVSVRAAVVSAIFMPILVVLGTTGTSLVLWKGGNGVLAGTVTFGTLAAFISYISIMMEPLYQIGRIFAELQNAQASAERIFSLLEEGVEIKDSEEVMKRYRTDDYGVCESLPEIKGAITFEGVSFEYKDGERVLDNFDLEIKSGEKIALVGETGSGKSTIVNLICRFYEPQQGSIKIDGVDYRERPLLWLQSQIGYVLQTPHLFSGTIRENIRYGCLEADEEEIIAAAKLVNAHNFISKMEKGYDSEVGEGGAGLSSGEKQLISFARAIIGNPAIFVLDEATSSVDTETEQMIQRAIEQILHDRTSFIVAHRLSTIRSADRILVIAKGKIIEMGNHEELLAQKGHYWQLYRNQFMEEMYQAI